MPRAKRNKQSSNLKQNGTPCKCNKCVTTLAVLGLLAEYCLTCEVAQPQNALCKDCCRCLNCELETHFYCQGPCRDRICIKSITTCKTCNSCSTCCPCARCVICGRKRRLKNGLDGCKTCFTCINCAINGTCGCKQKPDFSKARTGKAAYDRRVSIASIIQHDGTTINLARVPFHASGRNEFKLNPLKRFLSVEMEVAGLSPIKQGNRIIKYPSPLNMDMETLEINTVVDGWRAQIVQDVSLPRFGFEINTAPANGDKFVQQIQSICDVINKFGATCGNVYDGRKRIFCCGAHVHVDARDLRYFDLRRFLLFYELIEPALYEMLPGYRRASHFAQRCGKRLGLAIRANQPIPPEAKKKSPDPLKLTLITDIYGTNQKVPDRTDKRACLDVTRYRSVNLHQYYYRGTLEFRHMYGTTDSRELLGWAMLVGTIVDFSTKTSDKDIQQIIDMNDPRSGLLIAANSSGRMDLMQFIQRQWDEFKYQSAEIESEVLGNVQDVPNIGIDNNGGMAQVVERRHKEFRDKWRAY